MGHQVDGDEIIVIIVEDGEQDLLDPLHLTSLGPLQECHRFLPLNLLCLHDGEAEHRGISLWSRFHYKEVDDADFEPLVVEEAGEIAPEKTIEVLDQRSAFFLRLLLPGTQNPALQLLNRGPFRQRFKFALLEPPFQLLSLEIV